MVIKLGDLMWGWDTGEDTIGSSGILFCHEGEYLVCKRSDTGKWSIPWGRIKEGDDPLESAVRECREEAGIFVEMNEGDDRPELIHKYTFDDRPCYVYAAEVESKPNVYLNFEHTEYKWCNSGSLPKNMWEQIVEAIEIFESCPGHD